jgi:Leucine-rich repeat (LRR) protein
MTTINIFYTNLTALDIKLFDDVSITELSCYNNQIKSLPSEIDNLINLQILSCSHNQIELLPREIGRLVNLRELYCGYNQMKSLPREIGNLINLQKLYCWYNQIESLPSEIGNLTNLQNLYCNYNQIKSLPSEIGNLVNLREFNYSNNPIEHIPPNVIRLIQRLENRFRNAQNIYGDTQNVHNHTIQSCIKNSIKNILNHKPCIENHIEYILRDTIFDKFTKESLIEYSKDVIIHTELGISFDELLKYIISRIHENSHKDEIKKVLNNEMKDASCMCFTGRISRLVNCLNGFDPEIVITISDSEQISQIILLIRDQLGSEYTIETHKKLVKKELLERGFSSDTIDIWINSIE